MTRAESFAVFGSLIVLTLFCLGQTVLLGNEQISRKICQMDLDYERRENVILNDALDDVERKDVERKVDEMLEGRE